MAKVKKRRKHKPQKPPLSGLDKFLYAVIAVLHIALGIASVIIFGMLIPSKLATADESVVAFSNGFAIMFTLPLSMFWLISGIILCSLGMTNRQPLFGNKKHNSQKDITIAKVYPLFSADYWKRMRKSERSLLKSAVSLFAIVFLICAAFVPFGFCPRYTLDSTNHIKEYNSFNSLKESYKIEEAEKIIVNITKSSNGLHSFRYSYGVQILFVFQDNEYSFGIGSFSELDRKEELEYLLYLKSLFNGRYEITNTNRINALLSDQKFTAEEEALVYQLYDMKE